MKFSPIIVDTIPYHETPYDINFHNNLWNSRYGVDNWERGFYFSINFNSQSDKLVYFTREKEMRELIIESYICMMKGQYGVVRHVARTACDFISPFESPYDIRVEVIKEALKRMHITLDGQHVVQIGTKNKLDDDIGVRMKISKSWSPIKVPFVRNPRLSCEDIWVHQRAVRLKNNDGTHKPLKIY